MKILFIAQNFEMGGVQKALVNTLKIIKNDEHYTIDVFSFGKGVLTKEIPDGINVIYGSLLLQLVATPFQTVKKRKNILHIFLRIYAMLSVRITGSDSFYKRLFKKQKKLGKYDIAISYFNDVQGNYFNRGTNLFADKFADADKKIAWIHTDPQKAEFNMEECKNIYKNFNKIVCVSKACKQILDDMLPEFEDKTCVVYNFFPLEEIFFKAKEYTPFEKCDKINLVSVGRIDNYTKRYDLIPKICKMLKEAGITNYCWYVVGDGPDYAADNESVIKEGVEDFVKFVGEKENPYPFISNADLFILTSAYEGYPMVVGEALVLGVPVVATDYAASREQIIDHYNGVITGFREEEIFFVIKELICRNEKINKFREYILENAVLNNIAISQFDEMIKNCYYGK